MARAFEGFTEGQNVTDKRTGISYTLHGIKMRGDGVPIAKLGNGVELQLSRFREL